MPEDAVMLPSYHGCFTYGVDAGRRVMFPSVWRPKSRKVVFVALAHPIGVERCLIVLPPDRWQAVMDKIKQREGNLSDEKLAKFKRTLAATSAPLTLDKAWRFSLPAELADAAGISNEAQFVGRLDTFEIWSPERYRSMVALDKAEAAEMAREFGL